MAQRSFKVVTPPVPTNISRLPDGKFTRGDPAAPPQVVRQSGDRGVDVMKVIAENRSVENPRPKGAPATVAEEIPWAPVGTSFNEAGRSPFRIVG